jgi:hypothetical protein
VKLYATEDKSFIGCGAAITKRIGGSMETVTEARLAPPRGKPGDKPDEGEGLKKMYLTFSNFSIVRLSIPPHL